MSSVAILQKVARKAAWGLSNARPKVRPAIDTILEEPPPAGYAPGDQVVKRVTGGHFLEPEHGYIISSRGYLLEDSARANVARWERDTLDPNEKRLPPWRLELPSPVRIARMRRSGNIVHHDVVVSLRHWWEWNYYHFYTDVLGKLPVLDAAGIPFETPIVLGRYINQQSWARQLISRGQLAKRNWIVQDTHLIEANTIIYCRARMTYKERADYIVRALDAPMPTNTSGRRLFLNRHGPVSRKLINGDAVERCLQRHGFEDIDPAQLPVAKQMQLFADTRHLVAIHGAGLVNVIYRRGFPLDVIEMYGQGYNTFDFRNLSRELGYTWHGVPGRLGAGDEQLAGIEIDVARLERSLAKLV